MDIFTQYPDRAVIDACRAREVRDVTVAATVVTEPQYFIGRKTHARHESFSIVTEHGLRLRVVDNIDLAPRLPVHKGDQIVVAGQFIPKGTGGIIHDTHHSPGPGWHRGGWIDWNDERYESLES